MPGERAELDPVLAALGPTGTFATVQCLLYIIGYLGEAHQMFGYVFIGQDVQHRCAPPGNQSEALDWDGDGYWTNSTPVGLRDGPSSGAVDYGQCSIVYTANVSGEVETSEWPCLYGMEYASSGHTSFVSEFDLVCGRAALKGLTQTLLSLGVGVGSFVLPSLADRYGRKKVLVVVLGLSVVNNVVSALAPTYAMFAIVKFVTGFLVGGMGPSAVTACLELFPSSHRARVNFLGSLWWAVCIGSLSPLAYLMRFKSWRTLQLTFSFSCGLVVVMVIFLKEPIRWLVATGRTREALKVLRQAAKKNKKDYSTILGVFLKCQFSSRESDDSAETERLYPLSRLNQMNNRELSQINDRELSQINDRVLSQINDRELSQINDRVLSQINDRELSQINDRELSQINDRELSQINDRELSRLIDLHVAFESLREQDANHSVQTKAEQLGLLDLFRISLLRKNILLLCIIWFTESLTVNALYLMSGTLVVGIYLGTLLNCAVDVTSSVIMIFLLNRTGRRVVLGIFHVIGTVGLVGGSVCLYLEGSPVLEHAGTAFLLCGKMGLMGAFCVSFLYTPEIFPTSVRNTALGTVYAVSTLATMAAPFMEMLADHALWAPGAVLGTCSLLSSLLLLLLPESRGRELPQTLAHLAAWDRRV